MKKILKRLSKPVNGLDKRKGAINLNGRPALTPQERELRKLTHQKIIEKFEELFYLPVEEIKSIMEKPTTNSLTAYICSCIIRGHKTGDYGTLDVMFNRIVGKPKETLEVGGIDGQPIRISVIKNYDQKILEAEVVK